MADARRLERELQQELADAFSAAQIVVRAFGQGPPIAAPIVFRIVGSDPNRLREYGDQLRALLHQQPEVTQTQASILSGEPTLRLAVDESRARLAGLGLNEIQGFLRQGALPITVTRAVQRRLVEDGFNLAPGYRLEVAGDSAEQGKAVGQLMTYVPLLALVMVATLVLTFRSFALAGVIGLVAVLSVGLGMLSLWAGGYSLGFNPLIGSAGLVGVAINGSIVVLAAIRANPAARPAASRIGMASRGAIAAPSVSS